MDSKVDAELAKLAAGSDERMRELMCQVAAKDMEDPGPQIDKAAELQAKWNTSLSQLWGLGAFTTCPKCGKRHALPGGKPAEAAA